LQYFLYLTVSLVQIAITVIQFMLLLRALSSWFPLEDNNSFFLFIFYATEPIILPVRKTLEKLNIMQGLPIDISLLVTMFLVILIETFLPTVSV